MSPNDLPPAGLLTFGAAILFGAGLLRGFTGYGFAVAAVPLLSLICPPETAVPIVLVLQILVSTEGLVGAARTCDRRSVGMLAFTAALGTPLGVLALTALPPNVVRIGIALIVFAAATVFALGAAPRWLGTGRAAVAFGGMAGLFNGLAGMPGPPVIAYYLASPVGSDRARASMIVLFLFTGLVAMPPLVLAGALTPGRGALGIAGFPAVWLGSRAGAGLYRYSNERIYRWTGVVVLGATATVVALKTLA